MSIPATVGTPLALKIEILDQHGAVMPTPPEASVVWSLANPALATDSVSIGTLDNTLSPVEVGDETVSAVITIGAITLSASVDVPISPAPLVPTSAQIVPA